MVLHSGSGDGAKAGAQKTSSAKKKTGNASAALAEGLREAQREKLPRELAAMAKAHRMVGDLVSEDPFDDLDSDEEADPLCAACFLGKVAAVRKALAADADPNVVGSGGMTPLFASSQDGKSDIVAMLLTAKADPGQACFGGATPLYVACSKNHSSVAKLLVKAGAPVDALANGYYTPLLACVSHGCEDAARALLGAGADVHLTSAMWGTYLHAAAKHGKSDMAKLLLGFDANLDTVHEGLTPKALAESRKHSETAAVLQKAAERRAKLRAQAPNLSAVADTDAVAALLEAVEAAKAGAVELKCAEEVDPAVAAAAAAAAAVAAEKKRLKRGRQKLNKAAAATKPPPSEGDGAEMQENKASLPPSLAERRADTLLAERALAQISMEASKKDRFAAAVEGATAAKEKSAAKDVVSVRLHHLSTEASKKDRFSVAMEEAAAAKEKSDAKEEVAVKLRALVEAKVKATAAEDARMPPEELR